MSSAVNPLSSSSGSTDTTASLAATDSLGNENTFLQLLVAQIQNQDPTAPVDSSTFLTQLAEFSQLEQLIAIQGDVAQLDPTSTTGSSSPSSSSQQPGSANTNSPI
jgi:flagellar basal-body rod modification protein FlgD